MSRLHVPIEGMTLPEETARRGLGGRLLTTKSGRCWAFPPEHRALLEHLGLLPRSAPQPPEAIAAYARERYGIRSFVCVDRASLALVDGGRQPPADPLKGVRSCKET